MNALVMARAGLAGYPRRAFFSRDAQHVKTFRSMRRWLADVAAAAAALAGIAAWAGLLLLIACR